MAEWIVLGSGTAVPTVRRRPAGHFLAGDRLDFLFDSGSGALGTLAVAGIAVDRIRHAFYTHFHPDHTVDLASLIFALTNPRFHERYPKLAVHGPDGIERFYERLQGLYGRWVTPASYELEVRPIGDRLTLDGATIRTFPTQHAEGSLGYRIEIDGGGIAAYSGDSGPCDELVELGRDADLFVLECSFPDGAGVPGHLTPRTAGEIAARAGCRRLLLTHIYPECEAADAASACARRYRGEVLVAEDGMRVAIG